MAISLQDCVIAFCVILGILSIIACLARGVWLYQLWARRRGLYIKDFQKLSDEAKSLRVETDQVHRSVVRDDVLDPSVMTACLEIVHAADEYDTGIRIALSAWEDMIRPANRNSDVEVGKQGVMEIRKNLEKRHRRYAIGIMRKRCMEGMEKRRSLSLQMQWMLKNVVFRYAVYYWDECTLMKLVTLAVCPPRCLERCQMLPATPTSRRVSLPSTASVLSIFLALNLERRSCPLKKWIPARNRHILHMRKTSPYVQRES
jgi:hypothetical protein